MANMSSARSFEKSQRVKPEIIAEGYEYPVAMSLKVEGQVESWTERRLWCDRFGQAQAAEAALRARVAKAMAQIEASTSRGRGKSALRLPCQLSVRRWWPLCSATAWKDLIWFHLTAQIPRRCVPIRGSRSGRPRSPCHRRGSCGRSRFRGDDSPVRMARLRHETNGGVISLAQAVLAYRSEYRWSAARRLKGRPLSLTPHVCAAR